MASAALIQLLVSLHVLGAALGAGAIAFAEYFYLRAIADGKIDDCERRYLRSMFWGLKFGMGTLLITGLILVGLSFSMAEPPAAVFSAAFWMQQTLTLVILFVGWALSRKKMPWWLGAAAALTAWWMILVLHGLPVVSSSYLALLFSYAIATLLVALALAFLRGILIPTKR